MDTERTRLTAATTGDSRVDAAIEGLASLPETDLAERPAVLETVHDRLREILGELGDASGHGLQQGQRDRQGPGTPGQEASRPGQPGRRGEQGELGGRRW